MFFDLPPEQQSEIDFCSDDHFITIPATCHVDVDEQSVVHRMSHQRIIQYECIWLIPHICNPKGVVWPLIKTHCKPACRVTEYSVTAFFHLHGGKRNRFAALFILDNTSQYFRLGAHTEGYEEQQEDA